MDFKIFAAGTDQSIWRPNCSHGAGNGQWHHRGQCHMTDNELQQAELRVVKTTSADEIVSRSSQISSAEMYFPD